MNVFRIVITVLLLASWTNLSKAEERKYGSFIFNSEVPNTLFFIDQIKSGDNFELRKALRNHDIDTLVLASPGGSVWAGLSMAGIIFDKELRVLIPEDAKCASACSFMFFGGKERLSLGMLGVHQFTSPNKIQANSQQTQSESQFTVSEIIGFLNEFDTPRFVLERMFEDREMYWFDRDEKTQLNSQDFTLAVSKQISISAFYTANQSVIKKDETRKPLYTKKELITQIQKGLNKIGCDAGIADGVWGNKTSNAAAQFARKANIPYSKQGALSEAFVELINKSNADFCPKVPKSTVARFKSSWAGTYACTYNQGEVVARLTSATGDGFNLKLTFNKLTGHRLHHHQIIVRTSYFQSDGVNVKALPGPRQRAYAPCPDGAKADQRTACTTRPLEGKERLYGKFEANKSVIRMSGKVHPMGDCNVILKAR